MTIRSFARHALAALAIAGGSLLAAPAAEAAPLAVPGVSAGESPVIAVHGHRHGWGHGHHRGWGHGHHRGWGHRHHHHGWGHRHHRNHHHHSRYRYGY